MIINSNKTDLLNFVKTIAISLVLFSILSCASPFTEQFYNFPGGERSATINFSSVHGGTMYVIEDDISYKNGAYAHTIYSPKNRCITNPEFWFWIPDSPDIIFSNTNRVIVYKNETLLTEESSEAEYIPSIEILDNLVFKVKGSDRVKVPIANTPVIFEKIAVIGRITKDGILSWKRPPGQFRIRLVHSGWHFVSQRIKMQQGDRKYVEFRLNPKDMSCSYFHVSDDIRIIDGKMKDQVNSKTNKLQTAVFAGGAFWCLESDFENVDGVVDVISGYTGGNVPYPTYDQIFDSSIGHVEAVKVSYDPERISYEDLLYVFWRHIDPTDTGGQFVDRGHRYRSAVFYANDRERHLAEASKNDLISLGCFDNKIVTDILPLVPFYPAEKYHQDFYKKSNIRYDIYRRRSGRDRFWRK